MNIGEIIVITFLAIIVGLAIYSIIKKKKNGGGCCGDCSKCGCCSGGCSVHNKNNK